MRDVLEQHYRTDKAFVGVPHGSSSLPERSLRAIDDQRDGGTALLACDGPLRLEHVEHSHGEPRIRGHVLYLPAEHRGLRAEQRFCGAVDALDAALAVRHDDGIVQGVNGRFGRLLCHQDLAEVGLPKLPDPVPVSGLVLFSRTAELHSW